MVPFSVKLSSQIRFLLQSLNDSKSDSIFEELCKCTVHEIEGSILLLQACFDHLNIYGRNLKDMKLHPIYASIFKYILDKPNFSTILSESVQSIFINEELLKNLSDALHLLVPEKIGVGLALSNSEDHDTRMCGKRFCMTQITELCANPVTFESTDLIQHVLMFLSRSEGLSKHVDSFMQMLSFVELKEGAQFVITPYLSDELRGDNIFRHLELLNESGEDDFDAILAEMEKEISMADVMCELGYGCTSNAVQCKEMLSLFLPLSDATVAKILGTISRTYAGLDDSQNVFATFRSALDGNGFLDLPSLSSWNVDVLVESIKQLALGINWFDVMERLDHEGFYIPNKASFSFFMSVYRRACQEPFPLHAICGSVWKNVEGQLSFLKYAVSASPEVFTFAHSERHLSYDDPLLGCTLQSGPNLAWSCYDLLVVLCQLSERGYASLVRSVLEFPLNYCPEVLLIGMAHVNTTYNLIQNEVASAVLPMALKSASASGLIFSLWHVNPNMLLRGLINAVDLDPHNVSRILDACQEIKILSEVLDMFPFQFSILLAVLASKKEIMDLGSWLSTQLVSKKNAFYEECIKFLKDIQIGDQDGSANHFHPSGSLLNMYLEACPTILKVLQSHAGVLSHNHLFEEIKRVDVTHMWANSRLKSTGGSGSDSTAVSYADNIETESNSYFLQMFSDQLSIDDMIQLLIHFKESSDKRGHSMYECMIANVFEEYKFFSKYPKRKLKIAAVLFGSLIKHQLVTHLTLGIALQAVLDALRKPAESKMFSFGTAALDEFMDRLIEWPQYCNHILQISHLRAARSDLVASIEGALNRISAARGEPDVGYSATTDHHHGLIQSSVPNMEIAGSPFSLVGPGSAQAGLSVPSSVPLAQRPPSSLDERKTSVALPDYMKPAQSSSVQPVIASLSDTATLQKSSSGAVLSIQSASTGFQRSSRATSTRFSSDLDIGTLVAAAERKETPLEAPVSEAQYKISFIINNLSAANVEAKAKEVTLVLNSQYFPWFARYMMKRASIETNFHDLYLKFLDKVNSKTLDKEIVEATYENCKVLVGSERLKSQSEEYSPLKSLGSWLGKITIGKNQVLRAREIDPKSLIIEAYEKGCMIAIIPFTLRILESCSSSVAYQPPNPWTMGILGLLAEIYAMPNLKMNLKIEIELLFNKLGIDHKDATPTSLLKDRVREVEGNPDFSNKDVGSSQPPVVTDVKSGIISKPNQVDVPPDVAGGHSRILSQYSTPLHHSSGALVEDKKLVSFGFTDQLPSGQGLLQGQTQYIVNQVPVPTAANIEQQVVVNKKLQTFGLHLHFQSVLPIAMKRAVNEIVASVVQQSVSIATQTTKELVLKDYTVEPDETLTQNAAHLMVARLAGSLAHVTCKEPLSGSISSQLRSLLHGLTVGSQLLEHAVQMVTNDNLDLGCVLIEQAATEKAVQTIDGEIAQQLSIRKKLRESFSATSFDASSYAHGQMSHLPEALSPKPGRLSHSQQRVYEDFAQFPGQNQSAQSSNAVPIGPSSSMRGVGLSRQFESASGLVSTSIYSSGHISTGIGAVPRTSEIGPDEMIESVGSEIPASVSSMHMSIGDCPQSHENDTIASYPPTLDPDLLVMDPSSSAKEPENAAPPTNATLASKCTGTNVSEPLITTGDSVDKYQTISEKLENLLANDVKDAEIQGVIAEVPAVILRCISIDEAALAVAQKAFKGLYENASNSAHVDAHLAILAAIRDVSKLVVKELTSWVIYSEEDRKFNRDITIGLIGSELLNLAEYNVHMAKLLNAGRNKAATEFATSLIQTLHRNDSKVISELQNLVDALEKVAARTGSSESLQKFIEITKNPANAATPLAVDKEDIARIPRDKKATGIPGTSREEFNVTESVDFEHAGFSDQVNQLFCDWCQICELPGANDEACARHVSFLHQRGLLNGDDTTARFFRSIMELSVSHCLATDVINSSSSPSPQGQQISFLAIDIYAKLVFSVLKFFPVDQDSSKISLLKKALAVTEKLILKDVERKSSSQAILQVQFLYKGTLRVLLVLLHDFPEFLCDYHFSFCDVIPPCCIQMRNVVLSAFPRNMRLPDPSTPNLKIDLLPEISLSPRIPAEVVAALLEGKQIKSGVDEYLKTRQQGSLFLTGLKQKLLLSPTDAACAGTHYDVPLINSLVLYVGTQAIQQLQAKGPPQAQTMANMGAFLVNAALDILRTLAVDLDMEGRYLFLNAVANQLRYPNNHTHYFSFVLLYLFAESNQEMIQEQITRVLLERLIVNRPHPWGLLVTFIELIKNPRYNFWSRSFMRCTPEIGKLFESVSRSCAGSRHADDTVVPDNLH